MKPEYEKFRGDRTTSKELTAVRIPSVMKDEAKIIADGEGDSLSGLLIEGLARVIEDRRNDPNYADNLRRTVQTQVDELEARLSKIKVLQESLTPEPDQI